MRVISPGVSAEKYMCKETLSESANLHVLILVCLFVLFEFKKFAVQKKEVQSAGFHAFALIHFKYTS